MALIAVSYAFDEYNYTYGVVAPGYTWEQIVEVMANDPYSLDDYFDTGFEFADYSEFDADISSRTDIGYTIFGDDKNDLCTVLVINDGLGGVSVSDINDENSHALYFTLSEYVYEDIGDTLFESVGFRPDVFMTKVFVPVSSGLLENAVLLAFLAVFFVSLGIRSIGKAVRSLGRGR